MQEPLELLETPLGRDCSRDSRGDSQVVVRHIQVDTIKWARWALALVNGKVIHLLTGTTSRL